MNAFVLHDSADNTGALRWSSSAAAIVALHAALVTLGMAWSTQPPAPGVTLPVITVDLAPVSSAQQSTPLDLAPGPLMQQADASPPEAMERQAAPEEQIAPTPPQEKPVVEAPPEQNMPATPPKSEPTKIVPDQKPAPVKPKQMRADAKRPSESTPTPRTTASPRAERQAPAASAVSTGASVAAIASYNQLVAAHLRRFKQYPPGAKAAGEQGVARLSFSLGRSGQVLASRLGGSSGHAALDAETLAMVRRAQPFPAFPPDIKQASMSFSVPVEFSLR
jgi:protein TonB